MAKQVINVGTTANDKKGDSLRAAFQKVNTNFTELYTALGINADVDLNLGAFEFTGSTMTTTDSTAIVIDQATTITSNLSVGGDILPQTALGGDLGSSTLPWRSLYVSNNTIYIGGTAVGLDASGNLTVNGSQVTGGSVSSLVNGAYSVVQESTGNFKVNAQAIVSENQLAIEGDGLVQLQTANGGSWISVWNEGNTKEINLVLNDGVDDYQTWTFNTDRTLILPNDSRIKSATNIDITIDTPDSSTFNWQFGADGELTLPAGGNISEGGGFTGAIRLTPAGGANANQALLIYPTAGDGNHIHLTAGGGTTELYLGDDNHYVRLGKAAQYNGTIVIAATGMPNTVAGIVSSGNWAVVPLSNLATTGGTGTGLTVTVTQVAGVATAIAIVSGPMEGYTANDTITVTSGGATATFTISVLAPQWIFAPDGDLYIPTGKTIRDLGNGDDIRSIPGPYADDAAAAAASVAVGNPYHKTGTSGQVFVRLT